MKLYVLYKMVGRVRHYFVTRKKSNRNYYLPDRITKDINKAHLFSNIAMDKGDYRILEVFVKVERMGRDATNKHIRLIFG